MDKNLNKTPVISVIMPVYNAANYLSEAIESILNQTYADFEFFIFNDGSTDQSSEIIKRYNDSRIIFYDNHINTGYVKHLNNGLELASGKYIARMDADDISLPQRFEKQIDFMESNPQFGLCGVTSRIIGSNQLYLNNYTDEELEVEFFVNNPFVHSSVIFRADMIHKNKLYYKIDYMPSEDYELWREIMKNNKTTILPQVLHLYRIHENQISLTENKIQVKNSEQIKIRYVLDNLSDSFIFDKEMQKIYIDLINKSIEKNSFYFLNVHSLLKLLYKHAKTQKLKKHLEILWFGFIQNYSNEDFNIKLLINSVSWPFFSIKKLSFIDKFKFILKCLVKWRIK